MTRPIRAPRRQQRPPWPADVAFAGAHVLTVCVGLWSEFGDPSPSVDHILGTDTLAQHIWAAIFWFFGALALFANVRRRMRVEAISILCIGGGFALWALMVLFDPNRPSFQSVYAFGVLALIKAGWGGTLLWWINSSYVFVDSKKLLDHRNVLPEGGEGAGTVDQ